MLTTSAAADQLQTAAKSPAAAPEIFTRPAPGCDMQWSTRAAGFNVGEDLSVTDRSTGGPAAQRAGRQALAQTFAVDIHQRAAQLVALDEQVAAKTAGAIGGIHATFPQTPSPGAPPKDDHVHAVDNHTFKQSPPAPVPTVLTRMTPEQALAAYEQLKAEIRDHNSWRPPLNDAGAVASYNREADELNARKAALEGKLGKAETVPAPGTRLVPDWAQPAPEQPPGHPGLEEPQHHPFDMTTPHAHDLGRDPANGGFRLSEAETGLRVEAERGVDLVRSLHPEADWINPATGETYDAVGNFPARFFDAQWPNLQEKIQDHLAKAVYVPVDVSQFTAAQRSIVRTFVEGLRNPHVFIVGDG